MLQRENISDDLYGISDQQEKLAIQKELVLKKALQSDDVEEILKARQYITAQQSNIKNLERRTESPITTILVDPNDLNTSLGYKHKSFDISYDVLRAMARTPIVKSIITTRKTQISSFLQPQLDKYSTGFVVQPKTRYASHKQVKKLTKGQEEKIEYIIEFLLACGTGSNEWHGDSFDTFVLKLIQDSLTFDQGTFEVARDRQGNLTEFIATDSATMRIADSFEEDYQNKDQVIKGYKPSYVQVIDANVVNEYYPWQLCFGMRNPSTDIKSNGYGRAELEDMIQTVTALLNADHYNANFFKVGSAPKGILKYSGDINMNTIDQFKNQWVAQTAGVMNMHKIPMINAEKMDFVNLQQSNKDMEFSRFQEFLIKICCATYTIDPSEIGFPMSGSADSKPMFEGSNEARLKYSKDKGLKPLLKQIERWLNKYIISQIDKNYEFKFVGIDGETSYQEELDNNIKKLQNFMTLNEIRKEYNLDPIKGGDFVCNPIAFQKMMSEQQQAQAQGGMGGEDQGGQSNPFDEVFGEDEEEGQSDPNPFKKVEGDDSNPFQKGLQKDIARMLSQEI